jgi:hypothetical protein
MGKAVPGVTFALNAAGEHALHLADGKTLDSLVQALYPAYDGPGVQILTEILPELPASHEKLRKDLVAKFRENFQDQAKRELRSSGLSSNLKSVYPDSTFGCNNLGKKAKSQLVNDRACPLLISERVHHECRWFFDAERDTIKILRDQRLVTKTRREYKLALSAGSNLPAFDSQRASLLGTCFPRRVTLRCGLWR